MTPIQQQKHDFNVRAKSSMRDLLRSKSWVEKVESIERMNLANRTAKKAMQEKQAERSAQHEQLAE